jgi:hypothetical protein
MIVKRFFWLILSVAWPVFAQTASTHYDALKQSEWFAIAGGFAGATTSEGHAVAALCAETNAVATFQRLLQERGAAQQLYGLLGLHLLNAPEAKTALPPLLKSKAKVKTLMGCIVGEREVAEVARQIEAKQWTVPNVPVPGGKYAPSITER